jgi:hypothetical protein
MTQDENVTAFGLLAGALFVIAGTAFIYWQAAVVVAGLFLIVGALTVDARSE